MNRENKVVTAILLLLIIAGAAMKIMSWQQPRGSSIGSAILLAATLLLAFCAPRSSRALDSIPNDWRFKLLLTLTVIIALATLSWLAYTRYYGPLAQLTVSGGDG